MPTSSVSRGRHGFTGTDGIGDRRQTGHEAFVVGQDQSPVFGYADRFGDRRHHAEGFKSGNGGLVLVTATAGEGEVGGGRSRFRFLLVPRSRVRRDGSFTNRSSCRSIRAEGGTSVVPEITGVPNLSSFLLDYRRTFSYYNIGGPRRTRTALRPQVPTRSCIRCGRRTTTASVRQQVGTGSKDPISYYVNTARLELGAGLCGTCHQIGRRECQQMDRLEQRGGQRCVHRPG